MDDWTFYEDLKTGYKDGKVIMAFYITFEKGMPFFLLFNAAIYCHFCYVPHSATCLDKILSLHWCLDNGHVIIAIHIAEINTSFHAIDIVY